MSSNGSSAGGTWEPKLAISLGLAFLFFVLSGYVAYRNLETVQLNNQRIVETHNTIVSLNDLLGQLQDAETGQRGFLLTANDSYLEPYNVALMAIPSQLDRIAALTASSPSQQGRVTALRSYVASKLEELRQTIALRRTQGPEAALALMTSDRGKAEMDSIRRVLESMEQEEIGLRTQRLAEMRDAHRTAVVSAMLAGVLGILLTLIVGYLLRRAALARRRESWLQTGKVELGATMVGDQSVEELGHGILKFMAKYVDAIAGAVFVRRQQGDFYARASTYGVPADGPVLQRFEPGEGLLGEVASEHRRRLIDDVPDGYLAFGSALGHHKPRQLLIVPAIIDGTANTVIELGFLRSVDDTVLTLLDEASASIAIAMRSANYRDELKKLLEETQRQSEELQVQSEELRVSNEELEEQSRALKESQARLEQQQVELEQNNSQLEEQTQQLEAQRDGLEKANASVQLKARELEQASQYKSDFLANMSHELRTPLNSSLILAKLLADNPNGNLSDEQVKYAETIQSSGNDLLTLINDILDLSKIEAGHVEMRPEPTPVARLAANLRQLFQPIAHQRKLEFEIDVSPDAPTSIETDPHRLEQVLKNLLSNAFKFTEKGRVKLSVGPAAGGRIAFSVVDTGIGISEDQQKTVFEAFQQADGTISRRFGGTGLGLSISRELVRLLGGTLQLRSRLGAGSTFNVVVPEIYDAGAVEPRERGNVAAPTSTSALADITTRPSLVPTRPTRKVEDDRDEAADGKRTLLVIEDDPAFAAIVRDLSREMGLRALVAGSAEEAITLARQHLPSAIVLDIGLPDQSGLSVLDRLKRDVHTRHIPIHIVSATDQSETAFSLGAAGYAVKPVKRQQLAEVLQKLEARAAQSMRRVLVVEDDPRQRDAVAELLSSQIVETVAVGTAAECLQLLKEHTFDCMVLDLSLPDASGYSLLETLSQEGAYSFPPVIVYTGRELSADDEQKLRRYSKSIIIKGAKSPERLLDEVTLFLHQVVAELPDEQQKMIRQARNRDALLEGKQILVVEDDIRNVYALTNILEPRGAHVEIARNGQEALDVLNRPDREIDLVLMDVMMPVMDGLAATREMRKSARLKKTPVIVLTAKAMPDDQQRCIEAGANDYMSKPLDVEKLLSLVRVWLPR